MWGRNFMKAYEYVAEVLPDGHLPIPDDIKKILKTDAKVRVMLVLDDEEQEWRNLSKNQFFKGYSDKDAVYDSL